MTPGRVVAGLGQPSSSRGVPVRRRGWTRNGSSSKVYGPGFNRPGEASDEPSHGRRWGRGRTVRAAITDRPSGHRLQTLSERPQKQAFDRANIGGFDQAGDRRRCHDRQSPQRRPSRPAMTLQLASGRNVPHLLTVTRVAGNVCLIASARNGRAALRFPPIRCQPWPGSVQICCPPPDPLG
jgi:hypothetical protein